MIADGYQLLARSWARLARIACKQLPTVGQELAQAAARPASIGRMMLGGARSAIALNEVLVIAAALSTCRTRATGRSSVPGGGRPGACALEGRKVRVP
jgi:hypothetical protein